MSRLSALEGTPAFKDALVIAQCDALDADAAGEDSTGIREEIGEMAAIIASRQPEAVAPEVLGYLLAGSVRVAEDLVREAIALSPESIIYG